ncbi:hypothetical protein [Lactobacillus delbrueckii]|nr:hypothetical protein [Lactobacillus delbrueckii]WKZ99206.1 hypothetical protein MJT43_04865 [Lactobacillus delbrueckii]
MEVVEALTKLKFLVSHDRFKLVTRRGTMKVPVSRMLARQSLSNYRQKTL